MVILESCDSADYNFPPNYEIKVVSKWITFDEKGQQIEFESAQQLEEYSRLNESFVFLCTETEEGERSFISMNSDQIAQMQHEYFNNINS